MPSIVAFYHGWTDINPEQHRSHVSLEREGGSWSNDQVVLTVPKGWMVAQSKGGTTELYDDVGQHVALVTIASHRKAIQCVSSHGTTWLPMRPAGESEQVVCPTCGHPL